MVTLQVAFAAMALSGVGQTVLLDFYSDSCGPCREMNPTVQALVNAGYPVKRVNVAKNRALAAKYSIYRIPCFVMVVDGREVDRQEGLTSMSRLREMCESGVSAGRATRPPPMLGNNDVPPAQPIPSTPPPDAPSVSPTPPFEPWGPPAAALQAPPPLKAPSGVSDAALLAASVRLRVEDPDGRSCGSGTIIDCRGGEALVLTCGHIFRDSQGKGRVTVDLFGSGEPQQVVGERVWYDLTRDVGLVTIHTPGPVAVARVAPPDYKVSEGMPVASVGCNDGDRPSVQHSQVNKLNKYQGPPNLTVAGQPVEGRSGGGLFSPEGYVIGVCNAREPEQQEGLFAAPAAIYAELDHDQLAFVYKTPSGTLDGARGMPPATHAEPVAAANAELIASSAPSPTSAPNVAPATRALINPLLVEPIGKSPLPPHEQAALEEIRRQVKSGAKVIIVVCPNGNPDGKGDVFVVENASHGFVRQAAAEGRRQDRRYENETSLELPKPEGNLPGPRKVLLEWSLPPGARVPNPVSAGTP
jgi:thiol-disulfide isomerase/thioredoxin